MSFIKNSCARISKINESNSRRKTVLDTDSLHNAVMIRCDVSRRTEAQHAFFSNLEQKLIKRHKIRNETKCTKRSAVDRNRPRETSGRTYLRFGFPYVLLLEEELSVQIAHVNRVQVDLQQNSRLNTLILKSSNNSTAEYSNLIRQKVYLRLTARLKTAAQTNSQ